jgi:hypothetical protein
MAQRPGAVAFTVLSVGFALASCAFQSNSAAPVALPEDTQPAPMNRPAEQEGKKFSAIGSDADCVLTTGDIHFWCKWITRYY